MVSEEEYYLMVKATLMIPKQVAIANVLFTINYSYI